MGTRAAPPTGVWAFPFGRAARKENKTSPRQKVRGEMAVVNHQEVDLVTPAKGLNHLRVAGVISNKKFLQPRLHLLPVTFRPDLGQFIGGKGPAPGEGGNGVHQVGVAGDEGILGRGAQGGIKFSIGRVIFETDPFEAPGAQGMLPPPAPGSPDDGASVPPGAPP